MTHAERLDAFGKRVIMEELGGEDYPANAAAIATVLDRVAELEAALRSLLEAHRYACASEWNACLARARKILEKREK